MITLGYSVTLDNEIYLWCRGIGIMKLLSPYSRGNCYNPPEKTVLHLLLGCIHSKNVTIQTYVFTQTYFGR